MPNNLSYQCLPYAACNADALTVDIAAKNGARAVRSMSLQVAVAGAGKVPFHDCEVGERRMRVVDTTVQNRNDHVVAGHGRRVGLHGGNTPGVTRRSSSRA